MLCESRFPRAALAGLFLGLAFTATATPVQAQAAPPAPRTTCATGGFLPGPASYKSVEALPDHRVTFRLCAPNATWVTVTSSDLADAIPMGSNRQHRRTADDA